MAGLITMPREVILSIYNHADDPADVKALMGTCQTLKAVYTDHKDVIAKAHILRALGTSDFKLSVMAIASRDVDPTDRNSIERFLTAYVHHNNWESSNFTMKIAAQLPGLNEAVRFFQGFTAGAFLSEFPKSPTEEARVARTALMIETAANVFHRVPDANGTPLWRAPHRECIQKFWDAFSLGEIQQVYDLVFVFGSLSERLTWDGYVRRMAGGSLLSLFSCVAGLENLHRWNESLSHSGSLRAFNNFYNTLPDSGLVSNPFIDETVSPNRRTNTPPRIRFQPDPESTADKTWRWTLKHFAEAYGFDPVEMHLYDDIRHLVDEAFWEKLGSGDRHLT